MSSSVKAAWDSAMVELQKAQANLADENRLLREAVSWISQTTHRAHHGDVSLEMCRQSTCVHARDALNGKRTPSTTEKGAGP